MPRDPEKARLRKKRYLERRKVEKYGPAAAGKNMTGRHGNHARGPASGKWNHGRLLSSHGYVLIRVEKTHHRAFGGGYAYEHDLVMEAHLGRSLKFSEVVHHKNGHKHDNRIENLEISERGAHATHHNAGRERNDKGRFIGKKAAGRLLDGREWSEFPR